MKVAVFWVVVESDRSSPNIVSEVFAVHPDDGSRKPLKYQ
jgi:hypothetical protein